MWSRPIFDKWALSPWLCKYHIFSAFRFANIFHALLLLYLQLNVAKGLNLFISLQRCVVWLVGFTILSVCSLMWLVDLNRLSICSYVWLVDSTVCLCAAMCGSWTQPLNCMQRYVARGLNRLSECSMDSLRQLSSSLLLFVIDITW